MEQGHTGLSEQIARITRLLDDRYERREETEFWEAIEASELCPEAAGLVRSLNRWMAALLPLKDGKPEEARASAGKAEEIDLEGKRILLAEYDTQEAKREADCLRAAGFQVDLVREEQELANRMGGSATGYYDAILIDASVSLLNGQDAVWTIRSLLHPDARKIPIFELVAAGSITEDSRTTAKEGVNGRLAKPLQLSELERELNLWLGRDKETVAADERQMTRQLRASKDHKVQNSVLELMEQENGASEYNRPLFLSQAHFTDCCWEINVKGKTIVMLQDIFRPEMVGEQFQYDTVMQPFSDVNLLEEDRELWEEKMSLSSLSELREETSFEVTLQSAFMPPANYLVMLTPSPDGNGEPYKVYLSCRREL